MRKTYLTAITAAMALSAPALADNLSNGLQAGATFSAGAVSNYVSDVVAPAPVGPGAPTTAAQVNKAPGFYPFETWAELEARCADGYIVPVGADLGAGRGYGCAGDPGAPTIAKVRQQIAGSASGAVAR